MKKNTIKDEGSAQKSKNKIQRSSNKRSIPPKPEKKTLKTSETFINPFEVKQPSLNHLKGGQRLGLFIQSRFNHNLSHVFQVLNREEQTQNNEKLQRLAHLFEDKINDQLHQSLDAINEFDVSQSIRLSKELQEEDQLSKQQILRIEQGLRQLDPQVKAQNNAKKGKVPYQSVDYIKTQPDLPVSSTRSINQKRLSIKTKDQKQPSIDLAKNDGDDVKKISLSVQTKQALSKLQKYDKEFSRSINDKILKNTVDAEFKRQEKIKSIHRGMRAITYDNQLTVGSLVNILKYHADISKDVKERQQLIEKNEQLQNKINEINKIKNDEIKQLKMSLKSKTGEDGGRNRILDAEIKDFKKGNELFIPALKEGNIEKAKKLIEPQIKKLGNGNNKEIAFERKQLLEVILGLISQQGIKSETNIERPQNSVYYLNNLQAELSPLFEAEGSIEKNISHLEKCRRHLEPKIQDTKLFQSKQFYQTLLLGSSYIMSLYQELREKTNTIVSLNRKMADLQKTVQKTDRKRVQSAEKGEKIIEGLKDGLQNERRQSRQLIKRFNSASKDLKEQTQKEKQIKLPPILEQWQQVVSNVIKKLEQDDTTWALDIPAVRKRFLNKKQTNQFKLIVTNDINLFEVLSRKDKYIQKVDKLNLQLEKRLESDVKLQFKPNEVQKKYSIEKQKAENLLSQKNALLKQLKELQRQNEKTKDPQFDEIIQFNKLCFSIDSILKTPFNRQTWGKMQSKVQNKSQLKNLNTISNTLQNLYNKLYDHLLTIESTKPIKETKLKPSVKQLVKQSNAKYGNNTQLLNQIMDLIKSIIENQFQIEKYIELVNSLPLLINSLTQKILQNEDNLRMIQQLQGEGIFKNIRIEQLEQELANLLKKEKDTVQFNNSQLQQNIQKLTQEVLELKQNNELNKQENYYKLSELKNKWFIQEDQYKQKIQHLEQSIKHSKQSLYYKSRNLQELKAELESTKNSEHELIKRVDVLEKELQNKSEQALTFIKEQHSSADIHIQTETQLPEPLNVSEIAKLEETKPVIDLQQVEKYKNQLLLNEQHIAHLKKWIVDKQNVITNLENSELELKTRITLLQAEGESRQSNNSSPLIHNETNKIIKLEQQNSQILLKNKLITQTLEAKQLESNKYHQLSEKYRLMFEGCCQQMQELHQNSQEQMQNLTQLHLKNQSLLDDQVDLLKKEKNKLSNKLREIEASAQEHYKQIKKEQKQRAAEYNSLQILHEKLLNEHQSVVQELSLLKQQNIVLKERIIMIEKEKKAQDEVSEDMRKSFNGVLDKRRKRLQARASNKSNPSDSGFELSSKLATLLQTEGKLPKSALRAIIEAINKLILSNKKLIERVKRTERENNALYQAINQLTQNQQQLGQGISVIMHLQQVITDLVEWLDGQSIATEDDLKLTHYFQRLQGCLSKTNYFRYVQIFQQFLQHTIVVVFDRSQEELKIQNSQIDNLKQKLMVALDEHLHDIINEGNEGETDGDDEGKVLNQVRILLGVYLKTRNIKVIEDLVTILDVEEVSFG